jgi:hypothetical protein
LRQLGCGQTGRFANVEVHRTSHQDVRACKDWQETDEEVAMTALTKKAGSWVGRRGVIAVVPMLLNAICRLKPNSGPWSLRPNAGFKG